MKFSRFELLADPGTVRSGIYHDGRFYETDGENAVGIHDPSAVKMLCPIGLPPVVRVFDWARDASGSRFLTYSYANSSRVVGSGSGIDASGTSESLDLEVRIGAVLQASARNIEPGEAHKLVLGYGLFLEFFEPDESERLASLGIGDTPARDLSNVFGPFVVTPDDLLDQRSGSDPTQHRWDFSLTVNGETVSEESCEGDSFGQMIYLASVKGPLEPSEVIVSPPLAKRQLSTTALARPLMATDRVNVKMANLGALTARVI